MIIKSFSITNFINKTSTGTTWSYMKPMVDENGNIVYSYLQNNALLTEDGTYLLMENNNVSIIETTNEIISFFTIYIGRKIENIGVYFNANEEWKPYTRYNIGSIVNVSNISYASISAHTSGSYFDDSLWVKNVLLSEPKTITYTGDTNISFFRRYGKNEYDVDVYNPTWNTGFTLQTINNIGLCQKITNKQPNQLGFGELYEYKFWISGNTGSTTYYKDINNEKSVITYNSNGITSENSINGGNIKDEKLIGFIETPKSQIDVFIERGVTQCFERHIRLGCFKTINDIETTLSGQYNIKNT